MDASLVERERRDTKGLYAKARRGELMNFAGIASAYEAPGMPEIHVRTDMASVDNCVAQILRVLD